MHSARISALRRLTKNPNRSGWPRTQVRLNRSNASSHGQQSSGDAGPSPHAQFYRETLPAMAPIALLGSAIYFGLKLFQTKLSAEKHLVDANKRIAELEAEVESLLRLQNEQKVQKVEAQRNIEKVSSRWWWFS